MPPKRRYARAARSTYRRKSYGAYTKSPIWQSSVVRPKKRRAVARGKTTTVKRTQQMLGAVYNPMRSVGKDALDYLHMVVSPSQAPTVRAPLCSHPTAVASSRMRGAFTTISKNATATVGPAFAGWLRVMPAMSWYETPYNATLTSADDVAWANIGKVQSVTQWEGASTVPTSRTVSVTNDTIFAAAKANWGTYRPIACSVRIWNTSNVDTRNGTIYYGRTTLPLQVETTGPDGNMESEQSALPDNNNHYVALNGSTIDLVDGVTRRFTNSYNARIDGDDMYPIPANADVHGVELAWRTMGPDDFAFSNVHSTWSSNSTANKAFIRKRFQQIALDILVSGTSAQTFDWEVVTHYEFVPNELTSRIVQTAHGTVNEADAQRAREAAHLGAHGSQSPPETMDADMRLAAFVAGARRAKTSPSAAMYGRPSSHSAGPARG